MFFAYKSFILQSVWFMFVFYSQNRDMETIKGVKYPNERSNVPRNIHRKKLK